MLFGTEMVVIITTCLHQVKTGRVISSSSYMAFTLLVRCQWAAMSLLFKA